MKNARELKATQCIMTRDHQGNERAELIIDAIPIGYDTLIFSTDALEDSRRVRVFRIRSHLNVDLVNVPAMPHHATYLKHRPSNAS